MSIIRAWLLQPIFVILKEISMKQAEAAELLNTLGTQLTKSTAEINQAIADVRNSSDVVSPVLEAALTKIQASVQAIDDLNPDTPTGGDTGGGDTGTDEPAV